MSSRAPPGGGVPYFVMTLKNGNTKAVFTVPETLVGTLVTHPILCRGSSFQLVHDTTMMSGSSNSGNAKRTHQQQESFVSTEYYSPRPEETALAISERLAARVADGTGGGLGASGIAANFFGY